MFLVNLPFGTLAVLLVLRLPAKGGTGRQGWFDWLGLALFAGTDLTPSACFGFT